MSSFGLAVSRPGAARHAPWRDQRPASLPWRTAPSIRPGSPLARGRSTGASTEARRRAAARSRRSRSNVTRQGRGSASDRSTAAPQSRSPPAPSWPGSVRASAPSRCGDDPCARFHARTAGSASHAPIGSRAPACQVGCPAGRGCRRATITPTWHRPDRSVPR